MKALFFLIFLMLKIAAVGQQITLNLAQNEGTTFTQPIISGKFDQIVLINSIIIPRIGNKSVSYQVDIKKEHLEQKPLSLNQFSGTINTEACEQLFNALKALKNETKEKEIPDKINDLNKAIKNTSDSCSKWIDSANVLIRRTSLFYTLQEPINIFRGDRVTITVTRTDNNSKWTFIFECERESHWTTYYGFTFIPDALTRFSNYYAEQQDDGSYIISKMNGSNKNVFRNVSPTAMFTYRFYNKNPDAVMKFGLTGGIFYNTEILGAMFGPSWVIGDNLTLNTGVSFVQKDKLKGQYKEGQKLTTNLDFSQLHDKIWTYDMFISIGLNIPELFKKNKSSEPTDKKSSD